MANKDIPSGLKPVKTITGAAWNGQANVYYIPATDATAMFKGDAVKSAGSADATGKTPTVAQVAAGDAVRGVIIGFGTDPNIMINPDSPNAKYRLASTAMYCLVVDDPNVIFECQDAGTMAAVNVGLSADIVVGAGDTTTGLSGMEVSATKAATAATLKLLRLVNREDNEIGANAKWEVLIAEHEMRLATGV